MPFLKPFLRVFISTFFILSSTLWVSLSANASPRLNTTNPQIYYDIVTLTEWGYIDAAVTTFPIPWDGITEQLNQLDTANLPISVVNAALRLRQYIQRSQNKYPTSVRLYGGTDESRFITLNGQRGEQAQVSLTQGFNSDAWSGQITLNHQTQGSVNFDDSYLSYKFDDWNLRVGAIDQWWGPAQSSSLILSNNSRPIPAIALSRNRAVASPNSLLRFLGPWYLTAQLGQLESNRVIPNTKLWLTRFSFKPIRGLEIGASWTAMWGGDGQGNSLSDFFDVITFNPQCINGASECDDALHTKKGNHLAGFDLKYSFSMFDRPVNIYIQRIGEDAIDYYRVTDEASLIGISSYVGNTKVYFESSDTNVACGSRESTVKNCYYEHGEYQSGYRFHGRSIGSTFDSDAVMFTLGLNKNFLNGDKLELFLRHLDLNKDGQVPSPVVQGDKEKLLQLGGLYQTTFGNWLLKVGGQLEQSKVENTPNSINSLFYTELEYRLR